jgi:hypothetical protein
LGGRAAPGRPDSWSPLDGEPHGSGGSAAAKRLPQVSGPDHSILAGPLSSGRTDAAVALGKGSTSHGGSNHRVGSHPRQRLATDGKDGAGDCPGAPDCWSGHRQLGRGE